MSVAKLSSSERRAALSLAGIFALRMFGLFMIYPVFAVYARKLPDATPSRVGLALGIYGLAQALFQMPPLLREGFRYHWVSPWRDPTTRAVVVQMIPSAIGVAAFQINVTLTQSLAFGHNKDIVAEFFYAVRLMELPQGVFGLSLATFSRTAWT